MFYFALLTLVQAYNLTDCVSYDFRFTPSNTSIIRTVLDCENYCLLSNSTLFLIQKTECSCYKSRDPQWTSRPNECSFSCADGPCGRDARSSLYTVDQRRNIVSEPPQVNTISLGSGDGQDVRNTIRIASITVGVIVFLILVGVGIYCLSKRKKSLKIPQIESASIENATVKFLIQDLLPVAPTGLYSVISNFTPHRLDEISLTIDQVVAIKEAYSDKWAKGTNVTTGNQGFFPLTVLISDEKYLKKGIEIPKRVKSLKVSHS